MDGGLRPGASKKQARRSDRTEYNPINFSNIVIHTASSKKLAKQIGRKHHFTKVTSNNDVDTSHSLTVARQMRAEPAPVYPNVFDALLDAKFTYSSLNNKKVYLPASSTRKSFADYEEIRVEKQEKTDIISEDKLITIADNFDAIGRVAFANCKRLNPMQSYVYETAYKSNENMLVAAPTGAGKTNVAMMAVLNELRNHFKPGTKEMLSPNVSEKFKIIYIAPMKSLATEQTNNFNTRLKSLGIKTRELTGDMSLTADEISKTHIIVTTPEKWDVVTRKSKGDVDLLSLVRLLIIDEVHLLQSDRGPVLEALVARTLRYVETSQRMTRIVGLSATLPNYVDIASFLRVNPFEGLFYFDNRFRPVPLTQTFMGVRPQDSNAQAKVMDKICYDLALQYVQQSKQVMIFVHARNSTRKVSNKLREFIQLNNKMELFQPDLEAFPEASKLILSSKDSVLRDLFNVGFGIHHAGMHRHDRLLVERLFREGVLKVLVCTATLAWGVNFPAHTVIIRGTEIYDASVGKFVDVGLLDVMQIFGRAGRPQYDTDGHAVIITALDKMDSYLKLLTNQTPIESNFIAHLTDNLIAEIVSGTVTSVEEGMEWLRYTYLNVRLAQNPLVYGIDHFEIESDPSLSTIRNRIIVTAAKQLDEARMCRYDRESGHLEPTDLGRIASHFYINYSTITRYNELLFDNLEPADLLGLIGEAQEFEQIKYREEEAIELDKLRRQCYLPIAGGVIESTKGKVSCLLQAYISRSNITVHSLVSDLMYIAQNATRIGRGLFEYALKRGWSVTALNLLKLCKMLELQTWNFHSPFRHFNDLPAQVVMRLEETGTPIEKLDEMSISEVAKLVKFPDRMGQIVKERLKQLPYVIIDGEVKPIKSNLLVMVLTIKPFFKWSDRVHGSKFQSFWMWVVDEEITQQIYHSEHIKFSKEQVLKEQAQKITINIPLVDDTLEDGIMGQVIPGEFLVFVLSDQWNACDYEFPIDCRKIILPQEPITYTKIPPNLNQLPLNVLQNDLFTMIFRPSENQLSSSLDRNADTSYNNTGEPYQLNEISPPLHVENFNILQSQVFHSLYHSNKNVLVSGPTGSGKTLLADVAILKVFSDKSVTNTKNKIIYLTPTWSAAHLKHHDWRQRIGNVLQKNVMLLNDRAVFNESAYDQCDIMVASAEKFYLWLAKANSLQDLHRVALIIFDDMHLIGDKRGSHMELIVAKLNHLKVENPKLHYRFVGLSNTVANAQELASWIGARKYAAYNFHPRTARSIQLEIHVTSFSERHYSPRMASMNKPIFKAILEHSPFDPVLIFASSKKQCSLTAVDLISCLVHDNPSYEKRWLNMDQATLENLSVCIHDENLKLALEFGIAILYPSMASSDKKIVEELYRYNKIQVLICTTNYAWDSNIRAHLVVVKGTEHYDVETQRYIDYPSTDVMQMLGKAGRPNMDSTGVSVLMIRDIYKDFYKKFLHEPFPVESNFLQMDEIVVRNYLTFGYDVDKASVNGTEAPKVETEKGEAASKSRIKPTKSKGTSKKSDPKLELKRHALQMLTSTFFVRRLAKNPSYYGNNEGMIPDEFLSRYLDESKFLYENL